MKKIKAMGFSFVGAFLHIIVSQYAEGIRKFTQTPMFLKTKNNREKRGALSP